jgi:hypothetical protein
MGITVFFLICGPFAALLYVPLTTRQRLRPAHVNVARNAAESPMADAKEFQPIRLSREQDHARSRKSAA